MTSAVTNSDDFNLKRYLGYSFYLHGGIAVVLAVSVFIHWNRDQWSGTGSMGNEVKVNLVTSAGIPMPQPKNATESKTVDLTNTVNKPEPVKPPEPKTNATPIQKFDKEKKLPPSNKSKTFDDNPPPLPNAIPGHGGPSKIIAGVGDTSGTSASGVNMNGTAGGQFAARYPWYIAAAKRRVQPNWDLLSIDASVRNSQVLHCEVSFTIMRDGTVRNARVTKSSGNLSWDNAGLRAILATTPFAPLPGDWSAQNVDVLWDFPDRPASQ